MDISQKILQYINTNAFLPFAETLIEKFHPLTMEDVTSAWCTTQNISPAYMENLIKNFNEKKNDSLIDSSYNSIFKEIINDKKLEKKSNLSEEEMCKYIYSRGVKRNLRCNIKAKNGQFCSKHKNNIKL